MSERRFAAAAERNREPILSVLREVLPARGLVLEVASGTGQHTAYCAAALPGLTFQPSELAGESLASIAAWCEGLPNVRPPIVLDATAEVWPVAAADAIFNANMIHIAPWAVCEGLVRGASRTLAPGSLLILYGPFRIGGEHTAESNAAFDQRLRETDPAWGVRDFEAVCGLAERAGLRFDRRVPMPANNQTLVFRKA
jgi:SAM-dependent methyltransferase